MVLVDLVAQVLVVEVYLEHLLPNPVVDCLVLQAKDLVAPLRVVLEQQVLLKIHQVVCLEAVHQLQLLLLEVEDCLALAVSFSCPSYQNIMHFKLTLKFLFRFVIDLFSGLNCL